MTKGRFQVSVELSSTTHPYVKQTALGLEDTYSQHSLHTVLGTHKCSELRVKQEIQRHHIHQSRHCLLLGARYNWVFGYYPVGQWLRAWIQPPTSDWEQWLSGSEARVQLFVYHHAVISRDGYMGHPFFLLSYNRWLWRVVAGSYFGFPPAENSF